MSYGLIYIVPFAGMDNVPCLIEIEKEDYTGQVKELVPAETPFTVEVDDNEFLYTPIRFSTAVIRVVGGDYLQSLFSTAYQEYRVTFKKNGVVTWCGFIKPELYTQEYSAGIFELELECMSAMSTLEYIDYQQTQEAVREFVSIWELLRKCITAATANYSAVNIPHVYAKDAATYAAGVNVLDKMTLSEQNFFNEDDKPMKLKEVLEEVCKFLNWTCVDWMGKLYFVDVDHTGEFYQYVPDLSSMSGAISPSLKNVQTIGFAGSEHKFDILPGFNKVTVKCSNYPVGEIVPDEDYDQLKQVKVLDTVSTDSKQASRRIYLSPKKWNLYLYDGDKMLTNKDFDKYKDRAYQLDGATMMKFCVYNQEKPKGSSTWKPSITDYSFTDGIQIRYPLTIHHPTIKPYFCKCMSFKGPSAIYSEGAFAVSGAYKYISDEGLTLFANSEKRGIIYCQIRIGNKYYGNPMGDPTHYTIPYKWDEDPNFYIGLENDSADNTNLPDFINFKNEKTLDMPYTGLAGIIIPITEVLQGELEFTIFGTTRTLRPNPYNLQIMGVVLKDLKVAYKKRDGGDELSDNSDRIYENIINESYINEMDEIEFKISSYNNDGACYSKVMLEDKYLTDNLYSVVEATTVRPEEHLIRRIIKRYASTKIKLTQVIKAGNLTPITRLSDTFMVDKRFIVVGGSIDYKMNRFECVMIEV